MKFSELSNKIKTPYLLAKKKILNQAISEGRDVIDLSIAEPDFTPPYQLTEAFERIVRDNKYNKYTEARGIISLREKFASWGTSHYGFNVSSDNICVTSGARGGITAIVQALINPNDEVIIFSPYWSGYTNIIRLVGGIPKIIELDEEEGFYPTIEQLDRAFNPKTKMIILNNPHNPTGIIFDEETLKDILTWAEKKNIFVLADEVCMTDIFDNNVFHPIAKIKKSFNNIAVVRSFSKTLAIPGWRIGWVLAEEELINKLDTILGSSTGGVHSATLYALDEAWEAIDPWIEQQIPITTQRRNILIENLAKQHGFRTTTPQGGICAFSNIRYYLGNEVGGEVPQTSDDFVDIVFRKTGVFLSSGVAVGRDGFIRFCYTVNEETIAKAIQKISNILEK